MKHAKAWIGASGWNYPHWKKVFYPEDLPQSKWLEFYSRRFDTVEVNNSFYKVPGAGAVKNWAATVPRRFRFALKVWRGITHFKKLKDSAVHIGKFVSPAGELGSRQRAPLLVQLPPNMGKNAGRLDSFLDELKRATGGRWKIAVEFRNEEWLCNEIYRLLDRKRAALCLHDMQGAAPATEPNGASFIYVRRHGSARKQYTGRYPPRDIEEDAKRIARWTSEGRTVFTYFNNDLEGHAVRNAGKLIEMLEA